MGYYFRLINSKGEEIAHKINIGTIVRWLNENEYFEKNPDEVLQLEYRDLTFSHEITKDTPAEKIRELGESMEMFY